VPLLKGKPANPAGSAPNDQIFAEFLFVGRGGNAYALFTGDQFLSVCSLNSWQGYNGQDGPDGFPGAGTVQVPVGSPTPAALPSCVGCTLYAIA
jgi:hypothetical protein